MRRLATKPSIRRISRTMLSRTAKLAADAVLERNIGDNEVTRAKIDGDFLRRNNTLQGDGIDTALGVNISDIVEHLQQRIRYYTGDTDYSTDGSAAGQTYETSRYPKNIARVTAVLDASERR